ncbi:protein FAR1-RELATED SEQUENCE 5-like [Macadamia integrifolia]|uniref:protein FAR1-RELATED SEQUENCE 5-like n=1 Tax=Macadamia integrifolia TaxID=60698 RepID=UPI001C4ECDB1|nr:protein FAR1-RELATED SEQUENCE 5-like [Macadamia integrifolia]
MNMPRREVLVFASIGEIISRKGSQMDQGGFCKKGLFVIKKVSEILTARIRREGKCVVEQRLVLVVLLLLWLTNGWVIEKMEENHNHTLVYPGQIFRLGSHQQISDEVKAIVGNLQWSGLGPTQISDVIVKIFNGQQNVGVSEAKLKSFIKRNERHMGMEDYQSVLTYFDSIRVKDLGFIYSINLAKNGMLRGFFWVDSRVWSSYQVFGDVVVFDTTYKRNRYRWPFGPFKGVNNHRQSIIVGCGLVANETKESFEWFFRAWLNAMGNKAQDAIITDECTSIIPTMTSVFPNAVHRFCSWDVAKHAQEHLGPIWYRNHDFKMDWSQCIYRTWTEEQFLIRWEAMMVKYNLKGNSWSSDKFAQREHWVPCYLRKQFFEGMSSTQRSEGLNSYFQGYFKGTMTLYKFVK